MASFQEIARKKVAGVPVIYLAGGFVVILAIVAYKMKGSAPAATGDESTTTDNVPADGSSDATDMAGDYSGLKTTGTVVVAPQTTTTPVVAETNESWERSAVNYLIDSKLATPGAAQSAIHKYLEGSDLTYDEGKLRDAAITKLKLPPEPLTTIGSTSSAPAQKQFTQFPGKHTVKGNNDNTAYRLAALYYSIPTENSQDANKIVEENPKLGTASTVYPVGTVVTIPAKTSPVWFTTTASVRTIASVSAKNGMSQAQFIALNPGVSSPMNVGQKVRIR